MRVVVIEKPATLIDWDEARDHLRLDGDGEKAIVEAMIAAASAHIDGPDGWLCHSIGLQTLEARFSLPFGFRRLRLPYGPISELISVKYLHAAGSELAADLEEFEVAGDDVIPAYSDFVWEGASMRQEAGRIRYRAGHAEVPEAIKTAVKLMVGDLHRFRSTASDMNITPVAIPMCTTVQALLQPFRKYI